MKHPFWIANSILFSLVMFVFGFIYFSFTQLPEREDIEPAAYVKPRVEEVSQINISKVYENDLFGTYKKEIPAIVQPNYVEPLPAPPEPLVVTVPPLPAPEFLDPLDITLKGIIVISTDSIKNRAIIENNKTKQEAFYRVGDVIEDARVIRILSNKVIILRANGQQEVLYLREQDALADPAYMIIGGWDKVIQQQSENTYIINPKEFVRRIHSLGQFIDLLGVTTAYKQGESIGLALGQMDNQSIGPRLGLKGGDVILTIQGIPATNVQNRLNIYKQIVSMTIDDVITIAILRNEQPQQITYTLKEFGVKADEPIQPSPAVIEEREHEKKVKTLGEHHDFAPTVQQIRRRERKNMLRRNNQPATHNPLDSTRK